MAVFDLIVRLIGTLLEILSYAILARILLSWVMMAMGRPITNPVIDILFQITEPVLAPIRQILPRFGTFDFSPIVAMVLLRLMSTYLAPAI